MKENLAKFVFGRRPLTEWNDFVAEIDDLKADEVVAAYNKANARLR